VAGAVVLAGGKLTSGYIGFSMLSIESGGAVWCSTATRFGVNADGIAGIKMFQTESATIVVGILSKHGDDYVGPLFVRG
jgi:hypothetical protein